MLIAIVLLPLWSEPSPALPSFSASASIGCATALAASLGKFNLDREELHPAFANVTTLKPERLTELRAALLSPSVHAVGLELAGEQAILFLRSFADGVRTLGPETEELMAREHAKGRSSRSYFRQAKIFLAIPWVVVPAMILSSSFIPGFDEAYRATIPEGTLYFSMLGSFLAAGYSAMKGVFRGVPPHENQDRDVASLLEIDEAIRKYRAGDLEYHKFEPLYEPYRQTHAQFTAVLNRRLINDVETNGKVNPLLLAKSVIANCDWLWVPPSLRFARAVTVDVHWKSTGYVPPEVKVVLRLKGERRDRFAPPPRRDAPPPPASPSAPDEPLPDADNSNVIPFKRKAQ